MREFDVDLPDEEKALELVRKDCLSCCRCAIGGRCLDGTEWTDEPDDDGIVRPKANVFSTMNIDAQIMIVGQNPGADEVAIGEPFVGPSGKVFEKALMDIVGLARNDLYITNTVKCYTKGNRKPTQSEIDNCRDFLDLEMKLVQPKVAVALGSFAFKALTGMSGIMKHCGEVVISPRYGIKVLAMLHPSPYNTNDPERREMFELAMKKLAEVIKE
jgi:uracil-DNA glycosylase family 4